MEEILKLYNAVSDKFDVGSFEEFSSKMTDTDSRKRFYDVMSSEGYDLGDYDQYEQRLAGNVPKEAVAGVSGDSQYPSASTESSSESKKTLVEQIDAGEIEISEVNPDPDGILSSMEDRGLALKEQAASTLENFYKKMGVDDYTIDDIAITNEALRIKKRQDQAERDEVEAEKWEDYDFWAESWKKIKANSSRAWAGIAGLPNYLNKTMFTIMADDEALDFVNSLDPRAREAVINAMVGGYWSPASPATGMSLGMASAETQEEFIEIAEGIEADMTQFDRMITDDISNGDYEKATGRILSEGIGSIPSIVQAMIPYVGITSIVAGSAANKQEELEAEGYDLGLDTSANAAIYGTAEGLLEIVTKKIGGKFLKTLDNSTPAGREMIFQSLKENLIKAPLYEGGSEAATSLIQNLSDMYVQGKEKEFDQVFKEMADSFLIGYATGAGMGGSTFAVNTSQNIYEDVKREEIIKSDTNDFNSVKDAFNPDLPMEFSTDQLKMVNMPSTVNKLSSDLKKEVAAGNMTEQQAKAYEHRHAEMSRALRKAQGVKMSDEQRTDAVNKIIRKEKLQDEIKEMDDALAVAKKAEVEQINAELQTMSGTGEGTQQFFGDVVSGKSQKYIPSKEYEYESEFNETQDQFRENYDTKKGNFDEHIATSIPTFRDTQVKKGSAIVETYKDQEGGALVYDLGGSEGGFVKTITEESGGNIRTINLDPSPEMKKAFDKGKPEGSEMVMEAFGQGWEGVPTHKPSERADVVHESMMFQFIEDGGERASKIKEVKDNYLKDDGVFITEQKFKGDENYDQNEQIKNTQHKNKYYTEEQIATKGEEVLVGMSEHQADINQYMNELSKEFDYVGQYWKAGNFSGIIATNNEAKFNELMNNIGDTTNKYSAETNNQSVRVENAPEGHYINVGLNSGKTDTVINPETVLNALPSDVKLVDSGTDVVESDGGIEKTLSLQLSRPLTENEVNEMLGVTEQLAIPQLSNKEGTMFGSKEWGEFNPEFFIMPDLNKLQNESNTQTEEGSSPVQQTEGTTEQTGRDTGDTGNVSSTPSISEKAEALAKKLDDFKINSSAKDSMSKLSSTGLFEIAWDGSIEAVQYTIRTTGHVAQAIHEGVEFLRRSEWYNGLSREGKAKAERMLKEDLEREFGKEEVNNESYYDSIKASFNRGKDVLIQKIVDKYAILRKEINSKFNVYSDDVNFSQAEIQMHGKAANDLEIFDGQMREVITDIADKGFTVDQVSDYLYAKHAEERNRHIKENIDPENEFGSGMTQLEADKILGKYTEEQISDLESISDTFKQIIQDTRDIMLEHGLISREQYNSLSDYYENYVPLQGFENENIDSASNIQGGAVNVSGQVTRRAGGRSTRADNVIANIVAQRTAMTLKARKNEVLQTLYRLAEENPDNGVMQLFSKADLPKKMVVQADGKKVMTPERPDTRKDYVGVKVDGEQYYLKFANAELGRVLNAANIEKTSLVGRTLGSLNRYLSATLTTLDPEFVISNFARDIQTAILNVTSEADINTDLKGQNIAQSVVKDTGKAIKAIYGNERSGKQDTEFQKYYEEFKADGAKTGWANQADLKNIKKKLEGIHKFKTAKGISFTSAKGQARNLLEFINDVNTSVENGVRLSAYVNARKAGLTRNQAAALAKELTVNFNKSGEWGTLFNSMYLFFNASIQGNVRFIKAMTTLKKTVDSEGNVKRSLNRGQKLALAMTAFSAMLTMLNQSLSEDDEDGQSFYSKIPDYEKERNLIFMNPANGEDYFKIPLPYGYNIFHNLGAISTEVASGDRSVGDGVGFLTSATIGAFSPVNFGNSDDAANAVMNAAVPTVMKPIADLARNEDFFGSQIYNENLPFGVPKPDSSMGRPSTPEAFKNVSGFLNEISGGNEYESGSVDFAPESLYYLFKFGIGGTGKFLTNVVETANTGIEMAQGQDVELEYRKTPFLRKVYAEHNDYVDQANYFDRYDKIRQREKAIEARVADGNSEPDDRREGAKVKKVVEVYDEVAKKLKEIRDKKKKAEKLLDPVRRSRELKKLEEQYFKLIKKANKVYNDKLGEDYE